MTLRQAQDEGFVLRRLDFTRARGWRARLWAAAEAMRFAPFEWGRQDCATMTLACLDALAGRPVLDIAWNSERNALEVFSRLGVGRLSDAAAILLPEIHPCAMVEGDVAALAAQEGSPYGDALAVCLGERLLVSTPLGLDTRDRGEALRGFAAGRPAC